MIEADADLDEACFAHIVGDGPAPHGSDGQPVHVIRMLSAAMRALAVRVEEGGSGLPVEVQRMRLEPCDVVVAYVPGHLAAEVRERITSSLSAAFPSNRHLIVEGGIGIEVVSPPDDPVPS